MARFAELRGRLDPIGPPPRPSRSAPPPGVVLSHLSHGASGSPQWAGLSICYVARGTEVYRIAGRTYRVGEGEFMVCSQADGGDVEILPGQRGGTLGLCLFFPGESPMGNDIAVPALPVVLSAQCTALGAVLGGQVAHLMRPRVGAVDACAVLRETRPHAAALTHEIARHVDAVAGKRTATRYEAVRRVHAARSHLHATPHRAVPIGELAKVAGLSAFQLVRTFRDCFGEPPALYHRKLRLQLVRREAERSGATWQQACERYGFAGGSSFSHAWRRTFGMSPSSAARG
jgi:AraC-like DNA-binding protein